jgi:UDP-2,3-diacylglucosamine pyrophosphatase LpxH
VSVHTVTNVVSDLHVGGGSADLGDDHVSDRQQFASFVREQAATPEGARGDIELIINGDFLEFAQVEAAAYTLGSSEYWCSEEESLTKLRTILRGHPEIFAALAEFQGPRDGGGRNLVTLAAGNHDVDLCWPRVQEEIRAAAGPVAFEYGNDWYERHGGALAVCHGHQFDPANVFAHWSNPILDAPDGPRLEMCAGTLFMVKFVNWLEKDYPFSDNIKPVTGLAGILWKEKRLGLLAVGWTLARFLARHPTVALGVDEVDQKVGPLLLQALKYNAQFREGLTRLYREVKGRPAATPEEVREALGDEDSLFDFLMEMMPRVSPAEWMPVFEGVGPITLGVGDHDGVTLRVAQAGAMSDKEALNQEARKRLEGADGPEVIVMGHTHQPDELRAGGGVYFNPGSWTRYAELSKMQSLTLDDLRRESDYPYQLNYVRVERPASGHLLAEMKTYDQVQP